MAQNRIHNASISDSELCQNSSHTRAMIIYQFTINVTSLINTYEDGMKMYFLYIKGLISLPNRVFYSMGNPAGTCYKGILPAVLLDNKS